jgi:transcriptional regulator of acetoin/glycerol metabolism
VRVEDLPREFAAGVVCGAEPDPWRSRTGDRPRHDAETRRSRRRRRRCASSRTPPSARISSQKLRENNWNISKTAEIIDTPRSNLYKKLEQYGIKQEVDG